MWRFERKKKLLIINSDGDSRKYYNKILLFSFPGSRKLVCLWGEIMIFPFIVSWKAMESTTNNGIRRPDWSTGFYGKSAYFSYRFFQINWNFFFFMLHVKKKNRQKIFFNFINFSSSPRYYLRSSSSNVSKLFPRSLLVLKVIWLSVANRLPKHPAINSTYLWACSFRFMFQFRCIDTCLFTCKLPLTHPVIPSDLIPNYLLLRPLNTSTDTPSYYYTIYFYLSTHCT